MQLHQRERHYIDTLNCINKNHPTRTKAQYYQANKTRIRSRCSQKYDCECGGRFTLASKSIHEKTRIHLKYDDLCYSSQRIIKELGYDYDKIMNYCQS